MKLNLCIFQLSKKPLTAAEFITPLAQIEPIYKEEEEKFKVDKYFIHYRFFSIILKTFKAGFCT